MAVEENTTTELVEKIVHISRCAKVVKGGRRFSFNAMVVVGDENGKAGYGFGKAKEISDAIKKGVEEAKKNLVIIPILGSTIPHRIIGVHGAGRVLMRPAGPGTGIVAGGGVRAVMEVSGIKDVLTKSLGSRSPVNVVKATFDGLLQLRVKEDIEKLKNAGTDVSE